MISKRYKDGCSKFSESMQILSSKRKLKNKIAEDLTPETARGGSRPELRGPTNKQTKETVSNSGVELAFSADDTLSV
jgi:hypothetical protein